MRLRSPRSTSGRPPVPSSGSSSSTAPRLSSTRDACRRERKLSAVSVDIKLSALRARFGRGLGLIDRRCYAVDVEDAGEREAAQARTDDGDW